MGRKSQSKQNTEKSASKENSRLVQKRKDLTFLVNKVLKLTSVFQATVNVTKSWEPHQEINSIIKEIINIESTLFKSNSQGCRLSNIENFLKWIKTNGAEFEGIDVQEFEGFNLGLKANVDFKENSLLLTVPRKVMISEQDARDSELASFIEIDPLMQNMPNITLALFLLLEKNKSDSFWRPYIDVLPQKYSTVLYFTNEELSELKPSPVFEAALKLYRSIARQYAYFYNKIYTLDLPVLRKLQEVFSFENYRWAVSTVMTRQNNLRLSSTDTTAFIPLWDMCNHEHGKITTDFNTELNRGECYALRDFRVGEQIFIFYGARSNADLFLHNGFVYSNNQYDSLSLSLGVSTNDPLRDTKLLLLNKLGLAGVTQYNLYKGTSPVSPELLAFIRIFNMNTDELSKWSDVSLPSDLVSSESSNSKAVGADIDRRAYTYLLTRCKLLVTAYQKKNDDPSSDESLHRKNIKLLKHSEVQIINGAIDYIENCIQNLPTGEK